VTATVSRAYQGVLLIVVGAALGSIALDGRYLNYLKPAMHLPLLLAAVVFVVIGVAELVALRRTSSRPTDVIGNEDAADDIGCGEGGHDHHHFPRSGWLLVLPVLAIGFVAPPALGSWAAERDTGAVPQPASSDFPALPAVDPVPLALGEYGVRAVWDDGRTLTGRTVELVGFVSPRTGGGWFLTRMSLSCCAADALATKVEVRGAQVPQTDSWVRVIGRYQATDGADPETAVPAVEALEVVPTTKPQNPYE
jgi:uncharacterized repeat protein (TIGR03943 family)